MGYRFTGLYVARSSIVIKPVRFVHGPTAPARVDETVLVSENQGEEGRQVTKELAWRKMRTSG